MNATAPQHSVKRRFSASVPLDSFDPVETHQAPVPSRTSLSFEVMPPRHALDETNIDELLATLGSYRPDYISVTSSRNSGWLEGTARFIEKVDAQTRIPTLAHLACTAGTRRHASDRAHATRPAAHAMGHHQTRAGPAPTSGTGPASSSLSSGRHDRQEP